MHAKHWTKAKSNVEPKGQPTDTLEALDWVPEDWSASKMVPEALRGLGVPVVLVTMSGEAVSNTKDWACDGVGQLLLPLSGSVTLMCWPAGSLISLGSTIAGQHDFLMKAMPYQLFSCWADTHAKFVRLTPGSAFWMPYGWYGFMLARPSDEDVVSVLAQPYVTMALAHQCALWNLVSDALQTNIQQSVKDGNKWYVQNGPSFIEWLRSKPPAGDSAASSCGQPQAICNGPPHTQMESPDADDGEDDPTNLS